MPRPRRDWRLPSRAMPWMFAFYMAAIMALLMCTVITASNTGLDRGLPARILRAYALAMPVAFGCVLLVRPLVARLVRWSVRGPG
jgi:hypothetical protein